MRHFFKILKMVCPELLLLLHYVVYLLVERQQVIVCHRLALPRVQCHSQIVQLCLLMFRRLVVANARTRVSCPTSVAFWGAVWFLLGSLRGWVLRGPPTVDTSRRDVHRRANGVDSSAPLRPLTLLSLLHKVVVASLPLLRQILVYTIQRMIRLSWLSVNLCVPCGLLLRWGVLTLTLRGWLSLL